MHLKTIQAMATPKAFGVAFCCHGKAFVTRPIVRSSLVKRMLEVTFSKSSRIARLGRGILLPQPALLKNAYAFLSSAG